VIDCNTVYYEPTKGGFLLADYKLAQVEAKFADIIWANAPIPSPELVKICERELNWKKSTTYTELKKLCERGLFKNENAIVSTVLTREEFFTGHSRRYVEDTFGGSLPRFLAAFVSGRTLTDKQAIEIKRIIDEHREDCCHE